MDEDIKITERMKDDLALLKASTILSLGETLDLSGTSKDLMTNLKGLVYKIKKSAKFTFPNCNENITDSIYKFLDELVSYLENLQKNGADIYELAKYHYEYTFYGSKNYEGLCEQAKNKRLYENNKLMQILVDEKIIDKDATYTAKILNNQLILTSKETIKNYKFKFTSKQIIYLEYFLANKYCSYLGLEGNKVKTKKYKSLINKKIKEQLPQLELIKTKRKSGYNLSDNVKYIRNRERKK